MLSAFAVLLLIQGGILVVSLGVAVAGRWRQRRAQRLLSLVNAGSAGAESPRAVALAATRLIVDVPASRRLPIPPLERLQPLRSAMRTVLVEALDAMDRKATRRSSETVIGALLLLDYDSPGAPVPEVFRAIFSPDRVVATHAAWAVGRSPAAFTGGAVAVMSSARNSGTVSRTSLWSIGRLLARHPGQLAMMTHEPDPVLRSLVVRSAGEVAAQLQPTEGDAAAAPHRAICRSALRDTQERVRTAAAQALQNATDATSLESLQAALGDPSPAVQRAAVHSLASARHPWAVMAIATHIVTAPFAVRQSALRALALHRPEPPAALLQWLSDADPARVRAALDVLGAARADQQVLDSVFAMTSAADRETVRAAARTIATIARSNAAMFRVSRNMDRLLSALDDDDPQCAGCYIEAWAMTGDERVVAPLMARIPVSGRYVREKVVEGLALLEVRRGVVARQPGNTGHTQETVVLTR